LLSAYACSPLWGSEPGVGWQWLRRIARDHEVTLLTHAYFREQLEPALAREGLAVEVWYVQAPAFGVHPHRQLNSRLYYVWWQLWARMEVHRRLAKHRFDLIHHLTWGTLRFPCLLGGLGVPLVMGPLGGGEAAPLRLFEGLPWPVRLQEALRLVTLRLAHVDPLATWGPRRAELVLCKSEESLRALPRVVWPRATVLPEIGSPKVDHRKADGNASEATSAFRLFFAGRLLGVKGLSLALGALAVLVRAGHDVTLDIAGDGPLRRHLQQEAEALGIAARVRFLGTLPREQLMERYHEADLFVFPSLHDSSGNVVLEALSRGVPVVCLDLGGPQLYIDETCGVVVSTAGLDRAGVEQALAATIGGLLGEPARLAAMSKAAAEHAARQSWDAVVARAYGEIESRIGWGLASGPQPAGHGAAP
jgi:glycosyltransferase involved in cell wall biosynthesis